MIREYIMASLAVLLTAAGLWGYIEHQGRIIADQERDKWKSTAQAQARSVKQASLANDILRKEKKALSEQVSSSRQALQAATAASAADWAKQEVPESVRKALQ